MASPAQGFALVPYAESRSITNAGARDRGASHRIDASSGAHLWAAPRTRIRWQRVLPVIVGDMSKEVDPITETAWHRWWHDINEWRGLFLWSVAEFSIPGIPAVILAWRAVSDGQSVPSVPSLWQQFNGSLYGACCVGMIVLLGLYMSVRTFWAQRDDARAVILGQRNELAGFLRVVEPLRFRCKRFIFRAGEGHAEFAEPLLPYLIKWHSEFNPRGRPLTWAMHQIQDDGITVGEPHFAASFELAFKALTGPRYMETAPHVQGEVGERLQWTERGRHLMDGVLELRRSDLPSDLAPADR